jgi:hypothetical protein
MRNNKYLAFHPTMEFLDPVRLLFVQRGERGVVRSRLCFHPVLLLLFFFIPGILRAQIDDRQAMVEALRWVREAPRDAAQYNYEMTARVRLILFWAGKENVGGGYVRRGSSSAEQGAELVQVLFGSDPAKAPRAINRWGAGTEVFRSRGGGVSTAPEYSAFFGFMKSSKGKSVSEMQGELSKEKSQGEYLFSAILSRVDSGRALSLVVPMQSKVDYNLYQLSEAQSYVLDEFFSNGRQVKKIPSTEQCRRNAGFLGTVAELIDAALQGPRTPLSLCYVYDAQVHTLTLRSTAPLNQLTARTHAPGSGNDAAVVEQNYSDLLEAEFLSETKPSGKHSNFTLVLAKSGKLRGIPVQIRYQPNWWFQVVLNLCPEATRPEQMQQDSANNP